METTQIFDIIRNINNKSRQPFVSINIDSVGNIVEVFSTEFSNPLVLLNRLLKKGSNISEYFLIPKSLRKLSYGQYPSRNEIVNFWGEPEEYYSIIPILYLHVQPLSDESFLGIIHLSQHFTYSATNTDRSAFFCINDKEELVAFNRYFASMVTTKQENYKVLLGQPLNQFLNPTPLSVQETELEKIKGERQADTKPVILKKFDAETSNFDNLIIYGHVSSTDSFLNWNQKNGANNGIISIDIPFDWTTQDTRLEIEIDQDSDTFPSILLNDPPTAKDILLPSDRDGYLIGPSKEGTSIVFKKGGDLIHQAYSKDVNLQSGNLTYCKTGSSFTVFHNGQYIAGFCDNDGISRSKTYVQLYLRKGYACKIKSIALYISDCNTELVSKNHFASSTVLRDRYFLLSRKYRFNVNEPQYDCTLFQLTNVSDMKHLINRLEIELAKRERSTEAIEKKLKTYLGFESAFLGNSHIILQIRESAEKIAQTKATILIEGKTGTGKEVLARFIHANSSFSDNSFVKVDCSTLPSSLMESLLFGHVKGAYTGAISTNKGLLEEADNGTLFIDEAGNLTLETQAKLLQFLQDQTFTPVGASKPIKVSLRIIVASNIPLKELVKQGKFREDLYYRIAVVDFRLPELRNRLEDLPVLINHILTELNIKHGRNITALSPDAYSSIYRHSWPGNIRELKNVIERSYLFCAGTEISEVSISHIIDTAAENSNSIAKMRKRSRFLDESVDDIVSAIKRNKGCMKDAAIEFGVTIPTLYNFLKRNGISPNSLRKNPRKFSPK
jgi:two-component system response regulator AtoC